MKQYYVYILASASRTLYTGVTSDLRRRVYEHKRKLVKGFTTRYKVTELVYYEMADSPLAAIAREKAIKGWVRAKKIALVESVNPKWDDLSAKWFTDRDSSLRSE